MKSRVINNSAAADILICLNETDIACCQRIYTRFKEIVKYASATSKPA